MHEHLIAPRPVRVVSNGGLAYNAIRRSTPVAQMHIVTSPIEQLSLLRLDPQDTDIDSDSPRRSPVSPRPISTLPQETLEEFLSILRPSMMPIHTFHRYPTSPVRRTHKSRASFSSAMPTFAPQHFSSGNSSPLASPDPSKPDPDRKSAVVDDQQLQEYQSTELEYIPNFWQRSGLLHSPVSRNHTMNPFARRPSHENLALAFCQYAYPPQTPGAPLVWLEHPPLSPPLSPALIPLPRSASPSSSESVQSSPDRSNL